MPRKRTGSTPSTDAPTRKTKSTTRAKSATAPKTTRRRKTAQKTAALTEAERHRRIEEAAYYRAEARHFRPGAELQDWLDAERAVDEAIART